jgi:hypothetical protein
MRLRIACLFLVAPTALLAQAPGRWPPDSLVNTRVIPRNTPVIQVVGMMRNITLDLGVRCEFCHVGEAQMPLERFDFASDRRRTKEVARQMMLMVQDINRRLDTIPDRPQPALEVTCATCHRGVSRPVPLAAVITEAVLAAGLDSGTRAYRALREDYFGSGSYDFGEASLNVSAFRVARAGRFADAMALLRLNEEFFPASSALSVFRGNVLLRSGDTTAAAESFREALRRDSTNLEALGRLRSIGRRP